MDNNNIELFKIWLTNAPLATFLTDHGEYIHDVGDFEFKLPMGFCYQNALTLAQEFPDRFVYYEGLALYTIPMWHAWLFDKKTQKFIDPTWGSDNQNAYLGIPFDTTDMSNLLLISDYYGFFDNHIAMRMYRDNPEQIKNMVLHGQNIKSTMSNLPLVNF